MDEEDEARANAEPPTLPEFDPAETAEKFDEEFPEVIIPEEFVDEEDNDWELEEAQLEEVIAAYLSG